MSLNRLLDIGELTTSQVTELFDYLLHHRDEGTGIRAGAFDHPRGRRLARAPVYRAILQHPSADSRLFRRFCEEVLSEAELDHLAYGSDVWSLAVQCQRFRTDPDVRSWLIEQAPPPLLVSLLEDSENPEAFGRCFRQIARQDPHRALREVRARLLSGARLIFL